MASGLLALGAVLIGAQPAAASCAPQTLADATARADVVAFGTVTSVRMTFAAAGGVVTFRPERVLKGTLTRSVQVYLGPTHGGAVTSVDYQAAAPQPHTLYLRDANDGSYETDACSGSHPGTPSAEEVRALGQGSVVSVVDPPMLAPYVVAGIAIVLIAVIALIALRARRRSAKQ